VKELSGRGYALKDVNFRGVQRGEVGTVESHAEGSRRSMAEPGKCEVDNGGLGKNLKRRTSALTLVRQTGTREKKTFTPNGSTKKKKRPMTPFSLMSTEQGPNKNKFSRNVGKKSKAAVLGKKGEGNSQEEVRRTGGVEGGGGARRGDSLRTRKKKKQSYRLGVRTKQVGELYWGPNFKNLWAWCGCPQGIGGGFASQRISGDGWGERRTDLAQHDATNGDPKCSHPQRVPQSPGGYKGKTDEKKKEGKAGNPPGSSLRNKGKNQATIGEGEREKGGGAGNITTVGLRAAPTKRERRGAPDCHGGRETGNCYQRTGRGAIEKRGKQFMRHKN